MRYIKASIAGNTHTSSDVGGWVDVDMHTLQHKKYSNIFGLGDCTNRPNSKTAAAIKGQTPVVA
ncbi:MAG: hypothetical protein COB33_001910 [Thiotrichaceae bacterium]|nr:hypothetical protein [Thiotrichaceae bacterium]PCI13562.1 MAG: hypothetical protein COB71_05290 [Thiotrichales bacterium]